MSMTPINWLAAFSAFALVTSAQAGSLEVSPIGLELQAPSASATLTLRNAGSEPINAQIRIYKWSQENGEDRLIPTNEVAASPPMTTLPPGVDYTLRVIRTAQAPIASPETYRLIIDEISNRQSLQSRSVSLVVRYSIPVFFYPRNSAEAQLSWRVEKVGGRNFIAATNAGDQHIRLADVRLRSAGGKSASLGKGLVGYVLGGATMRWPAPTSIVGAAAVSIIAQTNLGTIKASSIARTAR